ncbi:MAG TPA: S-methyl-5-thioribose-1-phosphate isomerase [Candidatus Limnocylindrales bacterium]|nr:S-methyl-5-thioribose-1-phosphate isomerase [Candidatus Limnocylindrales bacterium]
MADAIRDSDHDPPAAPDDDGSAVVDPAGAVDPAAVHISTGAVEPAADGDPTNLARRRFFRQFAGELIQTAATVAGAAQALQRASAEAAGAILDPVAAAARLEAAPVSVGTTASGLTDRGSAADSPGGPTGFRTPFREDDGVLHLIDQRKLPDQLVEVEVRNAPEAATAIRQMVVRGAPAIGQVAAIGLALSADRSKTTQPFARRAILRGGAAALRAARPTAVNLGWAVERMMAAFEAVGDLSEDGPAVAAALRAEADAIVSEATTDHGRLAEFGLAVLPVKEFGPLRILTHCNTGPLACGQFGTALGIVQAAHHAGREVTVWVDETRPYLQGARLTAWELAQAGVPHTLIPDVAAGFLMSRGEVDVILVGADRVAANGDTANKVGTYSLAVLAARHRIPFYVCAPTNSVDLTTPDGDSIEIEERSADEVLLIRGVAIAPPGTAVRNPSFDVTPAELITGIVTEEGVVTAPYEAGLGAAIAAAKLRWAPRPLIPPTPRPPVERADDGATAAGPGITTGVPD